MKKGIKAQGMTFSGTANVSALYRRQKKAHTHGFRIFKRRYRPGSDVVSKKTQWSWSCLVKPGGLNEPSRVAGLRQEEED